MEEVEILAQEFRRSVVGFRKMCYLWGEMGDKSEKPGCIAYARQKAAMYHRMASDCETAFHKAGGTWPADGESLVEHVRAARPSLELDWDEEEKKAREALRQDAEDIAVLGTTSGGS
jgi:hypothetical protein